MTQAGAKLIGLDRVMADINQEVGKIEGRSVGGLLAGGFIIQAEAQRRAPVVTGNLRGSAYTRRTPEDPNAVEVGFGAAYALFVHENIEQAGKGTPRPGGRGTTWDNGQPKFLETAARDKRDEVVRAVAARAKS